MELYPVIFGKGQVKHSRGGREHRFLSQMGWSKLGQGLVSEAIGKMYTSLRVCIKTGKGHHSVTVIRVRESLLVTKPAVFLQISRIPVKIHSAVTFPVRPFLNPPNWCASSSASHPHYMIHWDVSWSPQIEPIWNWTLATLLIIE